MSTPEEIFDLALREHQAGRVAQAEPLYRRVLELVPQHADAWHLLGVAAYQQGRFPQAIEAIQRAVQLGPPNEAYYSNLGAALLDAGRVAEALAAFQEALRLRPDLSEAHNNLGNAFKALGKIEQALASYLQAIEFNPRSFLAHHNLAIACREMGRRDEALKHLRIAAELAPGPDVFNELGSWLGAWGDLEGAIEQFRLAVRDRPNWDSARFNLGAALKMAQRWDEAVESLRGGGVRPDFVEALTQLGEVVFKQGHAAEAEAIYHRVLRLRPDCPIALTNLGVIHQHGRRPEDAERCFREALRASPDFIDALNNLGAALRDQGQLDAAADVCRRGLELAPNDSDIHANLGAVALDRCDLEMALAEYSRAVELRPDCAEAHFNRSMAQLLAGDFERGWQGYEWRWKAGQLPAWRASNRPLWNGDPLDGRTILLHAEQGLGDTLQFVRYAPWVQQRGGRVLLECQPSLVRLLERTPGVDQVLDPQAPLPPFDVHIPLLSLPRVFETRLETIPAQVPYVFADDRQRSHWRQTLSNDSALKVGLVWQGAQPIAVTDFARCRWPRWLRWRGSPECRSSVCRRARAASKRIACPPRFRSPIWRKTPTILPTWRRWCAIWTS